MIPRLRPAFGKEECKSLFSSVANPLLTFERRFSRKFAANFGVSFAYGRTGLYAFLKVMRIQGKEVIMPAYTCVVVPEAVVHSGNTPVFIDSAKDDFNMRLDQLEKKITPQTAAVIATSIFGEPCDYQRIQSLVKRKERAYATKIYIIQDCAHSFGAMRQNNMVCQKGDIALFGLNISKIISTVYGGMVTTNDASIYKKLKEFQQKELKKTSLLKNAYVLWYFLTSLFIFRKTWYGFVNYLERKNVLNRFVVYYDEHMIRMPKDFLSLPPLFTYNIGLAQLKKYDAVINHRRKLARFYRQKLSSVPDVRLFSSHEGSTFSHFTILVPERDALLAAAIKNNIQLGWLIEYCIPLMPAFKKYASPTDDFPHAKNFSHTAVNLPVHVGVSMPDAKKIVRFLQEFYTAAKK